MQSDSVPESLRFHQNLPKGWKSRLSAENEKDYFKSLTLFLSQEYLNKENVFPPKEFVLRALQSVDFDQVKVLILGQDPYHGPGQAIGLSFAVPNSLKPKPPSLMNIFKEISAEYSVDMKGKDSDLSGWAAQGVLLLNSVLTVRATQAFSHRDKGWENFTNRVIELLNNREKGVVFVLWGAAAQKTKALITNSQHFVLESAHPSPLSAHRGFLGNGHFKKINEILSKRLNSSEIDWTQTSI